LSTVFVVLGDVVEEGVDLLGAKPAAT